MTYIEGSQARAECNKIHLGRTKVLFVIFRLCDHLGIVVFPRQAALSNFRELNSE